MMLHQEYEIRKHQCDNFARIDRISQYEDGKANTVSVLIIPKKKPLIHFPEQRTQIPTRRPAWAAIVSISKTISEQNIQYWDARSKEGVVMWPERVLYGVTNMKVLCDQPSKMLTKSIHL